MNRSGEVTASRRILDTLIALCIAGLLLGLGGCSSSEDQRERNEKTREEVAKATERARPELEHAGRELGKAAKEAAEEAQAAAQGVREGWNRNGSRHPLDLNSASEPQLTTLPGITRNEARKIIAGRPYRNKHELVSRGILSDATYLNIREYTTVN